MKNMTAFEKDNNPDLSPILRDWIIGITGPNNSGKTRAIIAFTRHVAEQGKRTVVVSGSCDALTFHAKLKRGIPMNFLTVLGSTADARVDHEDITRAEVVLVDAEGEKQDTLVRDLLEERRTRGLRVIVAGEPHLFDSNWKRMNSLYAVSEGSILTCLKSRFLQSNDTFKFSV